MSWTVMETELGGDYTDSDNPGKSTKSLDSYQTPKCATPDAVCFPMTTLMGDSWLLVSSS